VAPSRPTSRGDGREQNGQLTDVMPAARSPVDAVVRCVRKQHLRQASTTPLACSTGVLWPLLLGCLEHQRESCEPKLNRNPRYLRYSNAVSALRWIIDDLRREEASP